MKILFKHKWFLILLNCFFSCHIIAAENAEPLSKIPFKREPDMASKGAFEIYLILLFIVALAVVLLWVLKKQQGLKGILFKGGLDSHQQEIKIIANKRVNQHTYVHLLDVDGHKVILAENNQSLSMLELDDKQAKSNGIDVDDLV